MVPSEIKKEVRQMVIRYLARHGFGNKVVTIRIEDPPQGAKLMSPAFITKFICDEYGLSYDLIYSKTRIYEVRIPRQIAQYLMMKFCDLGCSHVGRITNRGHDTIINSIKRINEYIDTDRKFAAEIDTLEASLLEIVDNSQ